MTLGEPAGLWLLLLLVPMLLLHLLSRQRRRRTVSALWLWHQAVESASAGHVRRWPQFNRLLLVHLTALALMAFAASRPLAGQRIARHLALVVDVSASMATREADGRTRLEHAVTEAHRQLAGQHPDTHVMLVTAGRTPTTVRPFTRDRNSVHSALERLEVHHSKGHLAPAVALASERLATLAGETQLLVLTDAVLADATPLLTRSVPTRVLTVGEPQSNVAITRANARLERRTSEEEPLRVHVFTLIRNYGSEPLTRRVSLSQRNVHGVLATKEFVIPAAGELPVVLSFQATLADRGAGLKVELSPHDALDLDDQAYLLMPDNELQPVVLDQEETPWLRRALLADPGVELLGPGDEVPRGSLLVYARRCPERYPDHDFLVLAPKPGRCLDVTVGPTLRDPRITHWREEDPLFRYLSLSQVGIREAQALSVESPRAVLVNSTGGALMAGLDSHGRRGTVLGFDFGASDWPSKASFVVFVRNLIEQTRARNQAEWSDGFEAGAPFSLRLPAAVQTVEVRYPGGDTELLAARDGQVVLGNTVATGFYYASWQGSHAGSRLLPVNLTNGDESNPERVPVRIENTGIPTAGGRARRQSDNGWVFAAGALSLIVMNIVWATRRPRKTEVSSPLARGGVIP